MVASDLFEEVVAASRLTPRVAPFTVRRLLMRAGVVPPENVTPDELRAALPAFRDGLGVYLEDAEIPEVLSDLETLTRRAA
jgi:hypothetical protein